MHKRETLERQPFHTPGLQRGGGWVSLALRSTLPSACAGRPFCFPCTGLMESGIDKERIESGGDIFGRWAGAGQVLPTSSYTSIMQVMVRHGWKIVSECGGHPMSTITARCIHVGLVQNEDQLRRSIHLRFTNGTQTIKVYQANVNTGWTLEVTRGNRMQGSAMNFDHQVQAMTFLATWLGIPIDKEPIFISPAPSSTCATQSELAKKLQTQGVVQCPLPLLDMKFIRDSLLRYLMKMPEHKTIWYSNRGAQYGYSGAGLQYVEHREGESIALSGVVSLPSSYHAPFAVAIDMLIKKEILPIVAFLALSSDHQHIEMLPDRLFYRNKTTGGNYRRAKRRAAFRDDVFLVCIVNLHHSEPLRVQYKPGTHQRVAEGLDTVGSGASESEAAYVTVPPNSCLLVDEQVSRKEVTSKGKAVYKQVGFRLTRSNMLFAPANAALMKSQGALVCMGTNNVAPLVTNKHVYGSRPGLVQKYAESMIPEMTHICHPWQDADKHKSGICLRDIPLLMPIHPPPSLEDLGTMYTQTNEDMDRFNMVSKKDWPRDVMQYHFGKKQVTISNELPSEPPSHLVCPITRDLMVWPMVAPDGFTYEKDAIMQWVETRNTSPMTRETMFRDGHIAQDGQCYMFENKALKQQIQEWLRGELRY